MGIMSKVTETGDRYERLCALARELASWMDDCENPRDVASLARQYRETIREIDEIGGPDDSDGLAEIINRRKG